MQWPEWSFTMLCFFDHSKCSDFVILWRKYTFPKVVHVWLYKGDIQIRCIDYDVIKVGLDHNDRTICEDETSGFVKMLIKKGSDQSCDEPLLAKTLVIKSMKKFAHPIFGIQVRLRTCMFCPHPHNMEQKNKCINKKFVVYILLQKNLLNSIFQINPKKRALLEYIQRYYWFVW
ncbi:mercuric reductase [Reticulomyxa filosa]|uniref:Mercuric reductase n=1 Tax=Reticulomyxa filosa TaxID=46433 RepID=X6LJT7_RETFI|nr:mercuric reductase [Reticulomyxa filosa]|eukprot:ETO00980.1 mercuric reductase [Reticulomyxa filosa]